MANTFTYDIIQYNVHNQLDGNENVIYEILFSILGVNDDDDTKEEKLHHTITLPPPDDRDWETLY